MSGPTTLPDPFGVHDGARADRAADARCGAERRTPRPTRWSRRRRSRTSGPAAAAEHKLKKDDAPLTRRARAQPRHPRRARRGEGRARAGRLRRRDAATCSTRRAGKLDGEEPRPRGRERRVGAGPRASVATRTASGSCRPSETEELPVLIEDRRSLATLWDRVAPHARDAARSARRTGEELTMAPHGLEGPGQAPLRLRGRGRDLRRQAALPGARRAGAHAGLRRSDRAARHGGLRRVEPRRRQARPAHVDRLPGARVGDRRAAAHHRTRRGLVGDDPEPDSSRSRTSRSSHYCAREKDFAE